MGDARKAKEDCRIPDTEDIFGSVEVVKGKLQPGTYQRNTHHRLFTTHGPFKLSDFMQRRLDEALEAQNKE